MPSNSRISATQSMPNHVYSRRSSTSNSRTSSLQYKSNPTVGYGARDFKVEQGVVQEGAFCAVSGSQFIRRNGVSSNARSCVHLPAYPRRVPLDEGTSDIPAPSVLLAFRRHDRHSLAHPPGITFRKGSFCAVSKRTFITRRTRRGTVSVSEDNMSPTARFVLRNQSRLPPAKGYTSRGTLSFASGSHSAIDSGQRGTGPYAPNVLMGAEGFRSEGGIFEAGSLCAVDGDQAFIEELEY
ncbi:hypothetical protein F5877DRAFT_79994 [Lentinula edodes]|nr:hypothetical protein F5877DRAFT_79994 [Lentinula edodes]